MVGIKCVGVQPPPPPLTLQGLNEINRKFIDIITRSFNLPFDVTNEFSNTNASRPLKELNLISVTTRNEHRNGDIQSKRRKKESLYRYKCDTFKNALTGIQNELVALSGKY